MILVGEVQLRQPFQVESLPFMARIYKYYFNKARTLHSAARARESARGSIVHSPGRHLFNAFWRWCPVGVRGKFTLVMGNRQGSPVFTFNARNTQFHALYLDRYCYGYEPEVAAFLELVLPSCQFFVDVGANWGYFALLAISHPLFTGQVAAIEPHPVAFDDLKQLVDYGNLNHRISCFHCALGSAGGDGFLTLKDGIHTGETGLTDELTKMKVSVRRLDDLLAGSSLLDDVDVIKNDTEGSELAVLEGATTIIGKNHPIIIFESMVESLERPQRILAPFWFLAERGYEFFAPSWLVNRRQRMPFLFPDNRALFQFEEEQRALTLTSFLPDRRLMLPQKINCVAMTVDRKQCLIDSGVFRVFRLGEPR